MIAFISAPSQEGTEGRAGTLGSTQCPPYPQAARHQKVKTLHIFPHKKDEGKFLAGPVG